MIAQKMGLTLSDVLNILLRGFVRDKEINISLEEPSKRLLKEIALAEKERSDGDVSPAFSNAEDAIKWLNGKTRKHESKV